MQESSAPVSPSFFLPLWARIALACFMFAVSAVDMWVGFFRYEWVGILCMGLYFLIFVPRQKGEALRAYLSKPRSLVSFVLLVAIIASGFNTLHRVFTH